MRLVPFWCAALLAGALPAQALLVRDGGPLRVEVAGTSLADVIRKVVDGPDLAERRAGMRTAVPAGTKLLSVEVHDGRATITLSARFLESHDGQLELAIEQLT